MSTVYRPRKFRHYFVRAWFRVGMFVIAVAHLAIEEGLRPISGQ